jgi:hypothetical protein
MKARATRTAMEAYVERIGVCRDFAHLAITFCRCMNIPARYVNGHLGDIGVPILDPMDFSAWMEVYLGGRMGHLRSAQQHAAHRPDRGRARPRRSRRSADQFIRPARAEVVPGVDLRRRDQNQNLTRWRNQAAGAKGHSRNFT